MILICFNWSNEFKLLHLLIHIVYHLLLYLMFSAFLPFNLVLQCYVQTSPGLITDTDTEYRGISKYRYRYR